VTFWSTQTLKARIPAQSIITPYDPGRVTHAAYEMGVGEEAFVTSNASDKTQLASGGKVVIPPGQFGLLTTQETLRVPADVLALISIRASIKFQGLVNVSGFHVDPGYEGALKFAVYNAGSQPIVLDQKQRVFMIWFADLDGSDTDPYQAKIAPPVIITAADVSRIQGDVASPAMLKKQLDELKVDLDKRFHTMQGDIDKKFHTTEQLRLNHKWVLGTLVTIAIAILIALWRSSLNPSPEATTPAGQQQTTPTVPAVPDSLGRQGPTPRVPADSVGRQGRRGG
jgi:dCTP deaminase